MTAAHEREFAQDGGRNKNRKPFIAHFIERVPENREVEENRLVLQVITSETAGSHARFGIDQIQILA